MQHTFCHGGMATLIGLLALTAVGCGERPAPIESGSSTRSALVGGSMLGELEHPAIVYTSQRSAQPGSSGACTATKVGQRHFLTAERCVASPAGPLHPGDEYWVSTHNTDPTAHLRRLNIAEISVANPGLYDASGGPFKNADVALVRVFQDTPDIPVALVDTVSLVPGDLVLKNGYGCEDSPGCAGGLAGRIKLVAHHTYDGEAPLEPNYITTTAYLEDAQPGALAAGDYGGPLLRDAGARTLVVGVNSHSTPFLDYHTRVDNDAHYGPQWLASKGARTRVPSLAAPYLYPTPTSASTIEAEDYDSGGEGAAYHDLTPANDGGVGSRTGVDVYAASSASSGRFIRVEPAEWIRYTVAGGVGGTFDLQLRVSGSSASLALQVQLDGQIVSDGWVSVSATPGVWSTITIPGLALATAENALILHFAAALDVDTLSFVPSAPPSCTDGDKNGLESDVDCGGDCAPCADGSECHQSEDCQHSCGPGAPRLCRPLAAVGQPCTVPGDCASALCGVSGSCVACSTLTVEDGNPCTLDACDVNGAATYEPLANGASCSDSNACTTNDACMGALCIGTLHVEDDGLECTDDTCDPMTGLTSHLPAAQGTPCAGLDACHDDGSCDGAGRCLPGEPLAFDDGDPCTIETCDPVAGLTRRECEPLDRTVATIPADAVAWIHQGPDPLQTGVAAGTIQRQRAALISGRVLSELDLPLGGATVSVANHPELGHTTSQTNGAFELVVNGGGALTLDIQRAGFIRSQRAFTVPWSDYATVPDVVMRQVDPVANEIDLLDESEPFHVARARVVEDADGGRQATVLVPRDVDATMKLPNGETEPINLLNVRVTEFTTGANGPDSMPASLPPFSHYTHAFEIDADEAVGVGADVVFSEPLIYYLDNFLGFPAGTSVPVGSYDRKQGIWVPEKSGLVIQIVSVTGGAADINIDGSPAAEPQAQLDAVGITLEERQRLATLYPVGGELWRVLLPHFSAWDCNWNVFPPPDATPPPDQPPPPDVPDGCEDAHASTIECQNQVLRESVPVAGTPFSLNYSSRRTPGFVAARTVPIRVTGPTPPSSLAAVHTTIEVGGNKYSYTHGPTPNQSFEFTWDGTAPTGEALQGRSWAKIEQAYDFPGSYVRTDNWATFGSSVAITGDRSRDTISLSKSGSLLLGMWDARLLGLGGWSLDVHHVFDPIAREVLLGNGRTLRSQVVASALFRQPLPNGHFPSSVAVAPDGTRFVIYSQAIFKWSADGSYTRYAGLGPSDPGFSGDGGPAASARLRDPKDLELGPDGSLYIADEGNNRVRRVAPDGVITTFAGNGGLNFIGDGGPATAAEVPRPTGVGVGSDGSVYIAASNRVRRVAPNGRISTVAGGGSGSTSSNAPVSGPGDVMSPRDVAVAPDGSLLVTDGAMGVVRRVKDGRVTTAAGQLCSPTCPVGTYLDGVPANTAMAGWSNRIVVARDGTWYFTDGYQRFLHQVLPNDITTRIAGGSGPRALTDGVPGRSISFVAEGLALGPDGLYLTDHIERQLLVVRPAMPGVPVGDFFVASEDGREVYRFDTSARHLQTRDAITGAVLYAFEYSAAGQLVRVRDVHGNVTTVERAPDGSPLAIVGPYGQRTTFALRSDGYLTSITDPTNHSLGVTYDANGLLTGFRNARGVWSDVAYDGQGRLVRDTDQAGATKTLTRTQLADGWSVTKTDDDAGPTTYEVRRLASGQEQRTTTFPDGTSAIEVRHLDGSQVTTTADGTTTTRTLAPHPRFGLSAPIVSTKVVIPGASPSEELTFLENNTETTTLANPLDPFSVSALERQRSVNGRFWSERYNATTRTWTFTSPAHLTRQTFRTLNGLSALVEERTNGLFGTVFGYDAHGRVSTLTEGSRQSLLTYFSSGPAAGYLESARNPLLQTTTFTRDAIGRALSQLDPASNLTSFGWDADGNLGSVTPPGKPVHEMDYTPVNLMREYSPPTLASLPDAQTVYKYNRARQVDLVTRPDGLVTDYTYDAAGRLTDIITPGGTYHRDYYGLTPCAGCGPGRLSQLSSPDSVVINYAYKGPLLERATWSGAINGAVAFQYNNDFKVKTETITSASGDTGYQFGFAEDTRLTCASPTQCTSPGADALRLTYANDSGLPTGSTLGTLTEALTHSSYGELATQTGKFGTTTRFTETYDSPAVPRDALGRIKRKAELINGTTYTWDYTYDLAGRLQTVQLNGTAYETYTYDPNGNRLTVVAPGGTTTATYDDQDRLLTYGSWTYTYTPNGELKTRTNGSQAWTYAYDVFGNLQRVELPNADIITYVVDGQNRRVGKKRNGTLVKQWLYGDQLHPVAELDGSGALVARFVWASGKNTPDLVITGGVTYRVFTDQLGSPRLLVNAATGAVGGVMRHDGWGVVLEDTASGLMPFGFGGGLYDGETGLVRFGARDYDPMVGRWISKDPIRFDAAGTNLYAYALNDPVNVVDRDGRNPLVLLGLCAFGGCEAVAAAAAAAAATTVAAIACIASGTCGKVADKIADKIDDICTPRTPPPPDDCKKEWDYARERCLQDPGYPGTVWRSLNDCMRGLVREECGGFPTGNPRPDLPLH